MKKMLPYILSVTVAVIVNILLMKFDFNTYLLIVIDVFVCALVGNGLKAMKKK